MADGRVPVWGVVGAALLAGVAGCALGAALTRAPRGARPDERLICARADLTALRDALALHELREGGLPERLDGLVPRYLAALPVDPWGQPYVYLPRHQDGLPRDYLLLSLGGGHARWVSFLRGGGRVDRFEPARVLAPTSAPTLPAPPAPLGREAASAPDDLSLLLPPLLSAITAGALGLGVWLAGRLRALRRVRGQAEALLRSLYPARLRFRGPAVALRPRAGEVHCAWCRGDGGEPLLPCPGCATALHRECWGLAGRCPTLGCRRKDLAGAASLEPAPPATMVAVPVATAGGQT